MSHGSLLALAIVSAAIAAVPIVVYPLRPQSVFNPYRHRWARWTVYVGGGVSLGLFIVLSRSS